MARVIAFYVPTSFRPPKQKPHGAIKIVQFKTETAKPSGFWVALEKMLPD